MHDLIRQFPPPASTTDGRQERLIGEVIRAMARLEHPSIRFQIRDDRQVLSFRAANHPTITTLHVILERGARGAVLSEAMLGSSMSLHIVAEQRQALSHPEALLDAARSQQRAPWTYRDVQVSQEHASVLASRRIDIPTGAMSPTGSPEADTLVQLMKRAIETLSEALAAHARAASS